MYPTLSGVASGRRIGVGPGAGGTRFQVPQPKHNRDFGVMAQGARRG
jgi:hypothetical protein